MTRLITLFAIGFGLLIAGCGGDDDDSSDSGSGGAAATQTSTRADTGTTADSAPAGAGITVKASDSQYGQILFDETDQAIYLFDKEKGEASECYDACAEAWPPVLTNGEPKAGQGIEQALLGTTQRDDGNIQVTYNGHPLYYYAHEGTGEVKCHNVSEFGGLWLVVDPAGDAV
jgi:predicted lipoprotein with Yx(FWY)xxD motif